MKENLKDVFNAGHMTLLRNVEDVGHDESLVQPPSGGNCMNWLAGHLLSSRAIYLKHLGLDGFLSEKESARYAMGSAPVMPGDACTDFGRIVEGLKVTGEQILNALETADESALGEPLDPSSFPVPVAHATRGTLLTLLLFHDGYHTGQLSACRKHAKAGAGVA